MQQTRRRLTQTTLGMAVALGMIIAVAALAYRHLSALDERERRVAHTHDVLETTQAILIAVGDAGRARRAFAITRDEAELELYRSAMSQVATSRSELRRLTADNPAQQRRVEQVERVLDLRLEQLETAVREARTQSFNAEHEAVQTNAAVLLLTRLRILAGEIQSEERFLLDERRAEALAKSELLKRTMLLGFAASIFILLLTFLLLRREFFQRLQSEQALAERERHLTIILNSISDGVIAADAAGEITHMNPVAEQLTGWPLAQATGRPFAEVFRIINEKTRAAEPDPVARVLAEHVKVGLANQTVLIARDGVERPIADSAAPIKDGQGKLHGAVIVFRDVTETKAIEARFRNLVEAAPDGIVIADTEGRIAIVNMQTCTLFGYSAEQLVGQPVEMLIPEQLRERHAVHRNGYQPAPTVRAMGAGLQLLAHRKDGTVFPAEVSLSPLKTPEGMQVIASVRDVTQRHELERFRDEYVGYISHDLKNPLSVIMLQSRLLGRLLGEHASADEKRAVQVIADSAAFIDRLVRELLEMAYAESDQLKIYPEPIELVPFLEAVLARTVSTSDRGRVRLELEEPSTVSAESRRLERVLENFVQNALKYSPPGSPIRVRLEVRDDRAVVSVIDAGPGIAPEDRSYVFDKYKRTASAKDKEGMGLGLYISRKIIEAHGGEIGVDSVPGQGATFFVRLPRIAAPPKPATVSVVVPSLSNRLHRLKVLLVDDEAIAVSALTMLLGEEGLEVVGATSGEQALALAKSVRPDVAVLDVKMPGMTGLELLERLRALQPGLPAVIMSGYMENHAGIAEARESSGAAYVSKPIDLDELLRTLEQVCPAGARSADS